MSCQVEPIPEVFTIPANCRERFLPLRLAALAPLRQFGVELGGVSELLPPYEIGRPEPSVHVVLLTIAGEATCHTPNGRFAMRAGETWVLPAGQAHHYQAGDHWLIAWLHLFDGGRWSRLRGEHAQRLQFSFQAQLCALMEGLLAESLLPATSHALTLPSYVQLIIALLERMLERFDDPRAARAFQGARRLKEAVAAQLAFPWSNTTLAGLLGTSVSGARRLLRSAGEGSPMEIVVHLRMQHAQELLHSTDYTLERIAGLVGYATPFALSRAFRRYVGLSPQAFRASISRR